MVYENIPLFTTYHGRHPKGICSGILENLNKVSFKKLVDDQKSKLKVVKKHFLEVLIKSKNTLKKYFSNTIMTLFSLPFP